MKLGAWRDRLKFLGKMRPSSHAHRLMLSLTVASSILVPTTTRPQTVSYTEPIQQCARTDAYKAFEQEQYNQYMISPVFQQLLKTLRETQAVLKLLAETGTELATRPNLLGKRTGDADDAAVSEIIRKGLTSQVLPTCYENPLTYLLLSGHAEKIDAARQRLGLPLPRSVNLATLPTDEINAYTYPVLDGTERVVAVNTQLFMFAHQMTKVTLPMVRLEKVDDKIKVTPSAPEPDKETLINFSMAILEFLGLASPSTQPLNQAYDPLLVSMVDGMEKILIAHEYGHVIRGHVSPVGKFRLGSASDSGRTIMEVPVLVRSWQQELEADETGFQLYMEWLRAGGEQQGSPERKAFLLRGPLFFFRCLAIIEEARELRDKGYLPLRPTLSEKEFIRSYVAGATTPEQNRLYDSLLDKDHPPTWLRVERIATLIDAELSAHPLDQADLDLFKIAAALELNAERIWMRVSERLPLLFKELKVPKSSEASAVISRTPREARVTAKSADCKMPTNAWAGQLICTPELLQAVAALWWGSARDEGHPRIL